MSLKHTREPYFTVIVKGLSRKGKTVFRFNDPRFPKLEGKELDSVAIDSSGHLREGAYASESTAEMRHLVDQSGLFFFRKGGKVGLNASLPPEMVKDDAEFDRPKGTRVTRPGSNAMTFPTGPALLIGGVLVGVALWMRTGTKVELAQYRQFSPSPA